MTAVSVAGLLDVVIPPESVVRTRLANGLRVLVRRDASAPVVAIMTYVKAGYFDEPDDVVGIAHVLEHMYFKGTPARGVGEIARETKASGGYLNAGTIYDHTHYYAVLPSSGFAAGLAIQADAYAHSLIDAGELARELEVIVEEAKRKADSPDALATETLYALLHDRHRIRRWRIGREAGLRALTRERVAQFYGNFYRPSNTVLAVVGDVEPAAALKLVKRHYGSIPDAAVERVRGPAEPEHEDRAPRYQELAGDIQHPSGRRTLAIYSLESKSYQSFDVEGSNPAWVNDDRGLLFSQKGKLMGLDLGSGRVHEIVVPASATGGRASDPIAGFDLPRDQRTLFVLRSRSHADIWQIMLQ